MAMCVPDPEPGIRSALPYYPKITDFEHLTVFFSARVWKKLILMNILWENPKIWLLGSFPSYSIIVYFCF